MQQRQLSKLSKMLLNKLCMQQFTNQALDNGLLSANGLDTGADCPASAMTSDLSGVARVVPKHLLFAAQQLVVAYQSEALQSSSLAGLPGHISSSSACCGCAPLQGSPLINVGICIHVCIQAQHT